jgi:hypothetical protein
VCGVTLLALQRSMREHLIRGTDEIRTQIHGDPSPRLAVYHHAYRAQLVDCLRDTFERVWAWLGDAGFEAAARGYIGSHPPHSWTLSDYGDEFDRALSELYPTTARSPSSPGSIGRCAAPSMAPTQHPSHPTT